MRHFIIIISLLFLYNTYLLPQEFIKCGSSIDLDYIQKNDPELYHRIMELEKLTQNYINSLSTKNQEQIITIPVVVHVVYENIDEKIQAHQIQNQIDILNEDFRRLNSDTTNTPSEFSDEAVDTKIQFVLGCKESGITYTPTDHDYFYQANDSVKFDSLGGHDAWSADDYLNIWVCDLEENLLGYAQYPS